MLVTIVDVLKADELATVRALMARSSWSPGCATAGSQAATVKNNEQLGIDSEQLPALRRIVLDALERNPLFFAATLPLKILPPSFNRYSGAANTYGFHADCAMQLAPGEQGVYVRADVSATLFLSAPEDYDGGLLTIRDTFGTHGVKLPAGAMVVYPSSSMHAVSPVTRGERIACFMFMQSMVRDADKRRLLYDMDMALLRLRQELGEAVEPVVNLTAIYHNLLRRWADTA
jgi:PKHD-type hydroxylase